MGIVTTLPSRTQRNRVCACQHLKNPTEISSFHYWVKFVWFGWLACDFSYEMYIQKRGVVISTFLLSFSGLISWVSCLVESSGVWFYCLGSGIMCLKWALCKNLFFHVFKKTWVVSSLVPLTYTMIKNQTYNQCVPQWIDESGGQEAKFGDNTVNQIVPPIWWIILYISINITQGPIDQSSKCEGEIFPHGAHRDPLISQRGCCVTRLDVCYAITIKTSWPGPFRGKATPPTFSLHIGGSSRNMCGPSGSPWFFKHCMPGIHSIKYNLERKYVIEKDTLPN